MSDAWITALNDAERALYERAIAGEIATFEGLGAKPIIRAETLRRLSLLRDPPPRGIRISGARIEGDIDLSCAIVRAVSLKNCEIAGKIDISNAQLGSVSLDGSRLCEVYGRGVRVDGPVDFAGVSPLDGPAFIDLSKSWIRAGVNGERAVLKTPPKRPKETVKIWDHVYALRVSEAEILGNLWLTDHFVGEGGLCLDEAHVHGSCSVAHSCRLTGSEDDPYHPGDSLHAYAFRCDGMMALNFNFHSQGRVFLINSRFGSRFNIDGSLNGTRPGYDFKNRILNTNAALQIENCWIGQNLNITNSKIDCGVSLSETAVDQSISFADTSINNRTDDGKAPALLIERAKIARDVILTPRFAAQGRVSLARSEIGGDVDITGAALDAAPELGRAKIGGEVRGSKAG